MRGNKFCSAGKFFFYFPIIFVCLWIGRVELVVLSALLGECVSLFGFLFRFLISVCAIFAAFSIAFSLVWIGVCSSFAISWALWKAPMSCKYSWSLASGTLIVTGATVRVMYNSLCLLSFGVRFSFLIVNARSLKSLMRFASALLTLVRVVWSRLDSSLFRFPFNHSCRASLSFWVKM